MSEDTQSLAWTIDNPSGTVHFPPTPHPAQHVFLVYDKLITTSLKFTPVVLEHHCPFKTLPNGKL